METAEERLLLVLMRMAERGYILPAVWRTPVEDNATGRLWPMAKDNVSEQPRWNFGEEGP